MLTEIGQDIWTLNQSSNVLGFTLKKTMTVIRAADGSLLLHGPIAIDAESAAEIRAIGPVRAIIASSAFYYRSALSCLAHFPHALILYVTSLEQQIPDALQYVQNKQIINSKTLSELAPTLKAVQLRGIPYLNECMFYHESSRTLLSLNIFSFVPKQCNFLTALWCLLFSVTKGKLSFSPVLRFCLRDREGFRQSLDEMKEWVIDRYVLGQGGLLERSDSVELTVAAL